MNVKLTQRQISNILTLLNRVEIKGVEAEMFLQVVMTLRNALLEEKKDKK